jgi:hypothetical protein
LVDLDQFLRQLPETAKLRDFLFRFANRGRGRQGLGDGFAAHLLSELPMRSVSGIVRLSAVAGGLSASSGHIGDGARLKVAELRELLQEIASIVEQIQQRIQQESSLGDSIREASSSIIDFKTVSQKRKTAWSHLYVVHPDPRLALIDAPYCAYHSSLCFETLSMVHGG